MANRRAFLALFVAAGVALSTPMASAKTAPAAPTAKTSIILARATSAIDSSLASLILYMQGRLTVAYRALRGTRIAGDPTDGTRYHTDGIQDGPDPTDGLGAKDHGLHGATPAQSRRPGS